MATWQILGPAPSKPGKPRVFARCTCGTERSVEKANIVAGKSKCCGCTSGKGIPESKRFADKFSVDTETGCWNWTGNMTRGYGVFSLKGGALIYAHRYSWQVARGPIADGLYVDHLCRNTRCVNPDHLEPVTPRINFVRGESPSAVVIRTNKCKRGHEFTPENTYRRPDGGGRQCRACMRIRQGRRSWVVDRHGEAS